MGSLKEGRKALILVSEGYTNMLPPQLRDPIAAMPGLGNPNRGNPHAGRQRAPPRDAATFFASQDLAGRSARSLRRGEPEQRRHLRRRSARPARCRSSTSIRTSARRPISSTSNSTMDTLRDARRADRRPRHRQPQRSGRRHEADHARHERVLPARLQLDAGAGGRQVPRDQGAREAPGRRRCARARATGR